MGDNTILLSIKSSFLLKKILNRKAAAIAFEKSWKSKG